MLRAIALALRERRRPGGRDCRSVSSCLTTINASPCRARASRPSAPSKEASRLFLDVASTPPISGGECATPQFIHRLYGGACVITEARTDAADGCWKTFVRVGGRHAPDPHPECAHEQRAQPESQGSR